MQNAEPYPFSYAKFAITNMEINGKLNRAVKFG